MLRSHRRGPEGGILLPHAIELSARKANQKSASAPVWLATPAPNAALKCGVPVWLPTASCSESACALLDTESDHRALAAGGLAGAGDRPTRIPSGRENRGVDEIMVHVAICRARTAFHLPYA